ncbi:MAG: FitA-like ribbon-helix-helix domain-containing protein [Acidimicrobiales bacterium]
MDINVKNLDADVVARLAEQAEAEGMSQQEWIRQTLRRSTARLSPAELLRRRRDAEPMNEEEFATIRERAANRRTAAVEGLGARQRRR